MLFVVKEFDVFTQISLCTETEIKIVGFKAALFSSLYAVKFFSKFRFFVFFDCLRKFLTSSDNIYYKFLIIFNEHSTSTLSPIINAKDRESIKKNYSRNYIYKSLTMPPLFHCFRVLKPPGGGSSDIFGAAPEETSPRRVKNHNQSQLGSALFGDTPNNSNSNETPRNKPGNDSYNRLFGPPDAPPTTPNAKNHMRSNISLSGESMSSSVSSGAATSPAKSTGSSDSIAGVLNGYAASNGNNMTNDVTGKGVNSPSFQRIQQPPIPPLPHLCITKKGYTVYLVR